MKDSKDSETRDITGFVLEMQGYVREGVTLWMNGKTCTPIRAAQECLLREDECYMRDYVCDEENRIIQIRFDRVEPVPEDCIGLYHYRKES